MVTDTAVVRGAPLPHWAQPLDLPPPEAECAPVLMRLADTQLWAGDGPHDPPSYLVNRAEQVNDAAALGQIGQVSLQFNPLYQRLLLHRVGIVRGQAFIDHTAGAPLRLLQRESGLEHGVVSGVVTATMVLPDVRVGDTLHITCTVEGENPVFAGRYAGWAGWDQAQPVALRHVTLIAPAQRRIHWRWIGDRDGPRPAPAESIAHGLRRLHFQGHQLPGVAFEPYLPRDAYPLRWLQFSEFGSWAEVAQWARALFPADAPLPASLAPLLQQLQALPTPQERVSQALQWVQAQIRYCSVSLGESSHRPHMPAEVVARRYGDCKDKSFLLARLLQALGIEAHPALVAAQTRQGPLKLLPSPEAFDHVIVQVRLDDREHYLDPTRLGQSGPLEHMGQGLEDAAVLVVAPGTTQLARVHSPNRTQLFANELHERYVVERFGEPALLESAQHWHGLGAESLRAMLAPMDAAQLARWALGRYERRHPGLALEAPPQVLHDAECNRLTVSARYRVPEAVGTSEGDWTLHFVAANLHAAFAIPESLQRTLPLAVPSFPGVMRYEVEVQWPDGAGAVVPPHTERLDTPHFALRVTRSQRGGVAREAVVLQPLVPAVPAQAVPRLVQDLRRLDALVQGRLSLPRDAVHSPPPALRQRMAAQLQAQAERAARAIARGQLHGEDLAAAHCLRAEALAELGHGGPALHEANAALALAPALPPAWSCRGKVSWLLGRFREAAQDFGRALQLDGDPAACRLQRGQARFYEGRFDAAAEDFARAAQSSTDQAQRCQALLWQGWALRRMGRTLPPTLLAAARRGARAAWPLPALGLLDGSLGAAQLLAEAHQARGDALALALTEAWFALGQHHLLHGLCDRAREAFENTRAAGVTRYAEHAAAGFELARLGVPVP
ncbi:MAG: DUF3857 domain-containing protein [Pseudomonadota bacterium]